MKFPYQFHTQKEGDLDFHHLLINDLLNILNICKLEKYEETQSVCEKNSFRTKNLLGTTLGNEIVEKIIDHLFVNNWCANTLINRIALNSSPYWFHIVEYGIEGFELPNKNENETFCLVIPLNKSNKEIRINENKTSDIVFSFMNTKHYFIYNGGLVRKVIDNTYSKDIAKVAFISFFYDYEKAKRKHKTPEKITKKNLLKRLLNKIFSMWT